MPRVWKPFQTAGAGRGGGQQVRPPRLLVFAGPPEVPLLLLLPMLMLALLRTWLLWLQL